MARRTASNESLRATRRSCQYDAYFQTGDLAASMSDMGAKLTGAQISQPITTGQPRRSWSVGHAMGGERPDANAARQLQQACKSCH